MHPGQPADGVLGAVTVTFVHTSPESPSVSGTVAYSGRIVAFDGWMTLLGELERVVTQLTADELKGPTASTKSM